MKIIELQGKRVIDSFSEKQAKRTKVINMKFDEKYELKQEQYELLRKLHYNIVSKDLNEQKISDFIKQELKKKHYSYRQQDIKKEILDDNALISLEQIIEKLTDSLLECYYCNKEVKVIYEDVRDPKQWTLDRINNDLGHIKDNVVICCLKCNLQRRRLDDEKFLFTKQLKLIKKDGLVEN